MSRYVSFLLGTILCLWATFATAMPSYTNMYVFGDSLSDNGNLFDFTGGVVPFPAYYDQGRFQNGPTYAEYLWSALGLPGNLSPRIYAPVPLQGTNYAVGGARSRYHVSDLVAGLPPPLANPPTPFSLLGQVGLYQFDSMGIADPNALYTLWAGGNDASDILNVKRNVGESEANDYLAQSVNDISAAIAALVGSGVRHLLVPNVPDIGLTPEVQALDDIDPGAAADATEISMAINDEVNLVLQGFAGVPDLDIIRFDTFSLLQQIIADPGSYGFANAIDPCLENFFVVPPPTGSVSVCTTPDDYVFWDIFHPSAKTQQVLGEQMAAAIPEPTPLLIITIGALLLTIYSGRGKKAGLAFSD